MDADTPMKKRISKVVHVMFENRSFDHLLGWLYNGEQSPDVHTIGESSGPKFDGLSTELLSSFAQPVDFETGGSASLPLVRGVQGNFLPCNTPIIDPTEGFKPTARQIYGPNVEIPVPRNADASMLGFLQSYYDNILDRLTFDVAFREILDTYDYHQVPVINTLAKEFAVSDRWFSSIPSETNINRAFSLCGNSIGWQTEADKRSHTTTAMVNNHYYTGCLPAQFSTRSIWELLSDSGHNTAEDWRIYYSDVWPPLPLLVPPCRRGTFSFTYEMVPSLQKTLKHRIRSPLDQMYKKIDAFFTDAANGDLPRFTYIEPTYSLDFLASLGYPGDDYHPSSDVRSGEAFLGKIYDALTGSGLWDETLLFVTFDEHGGTFDHVPPPTDAINPAPEGATDPPPADRNELGFAFDRFGVRVPTIFVSPWIRKNTVIRSNPGRPPFDHTSFLATLIDWWGGLDRAALGKRVEAAASFEQVIGDEKRSMPACPPLFDCRHRKDLEDREVSISRAARIASLIAMAGDRSPRRALQRVLKLGRSERLVAKYARRIFRV